MEFLALKWSVTEKFSDYLINSHFSVLTDNNPLTYILTSAKLDATGQRWVSSLGNYSFDITYRSGLRNADADALSRYPHEKVIHEEEEKVRIDNSTVKAICSCITSPPFIEILPSHSINILEATEEQGQPMAQIEMREVRRAQRQDRMIDRWRIATIDKEVSNYDMSKEDHIMNN